MKHLFLIALCCAVSLVSNSQTSSKVEWTMVKTIGDTIEIDTSKVKFLFIGNKTRSINQRDTIPVYVFDKIDTSGVVDMLVEDRKGRITKQTGRYIFSHKIGTFDGKGFFNFPSQEMIIGALDTKQRRVKPYLNGR